VTVQRKDRAARVGAITCRCASSHGSCRASKNEIAGEGAVQDSDTSAIVEDGAPQGRAAASIALISGTCE
jgi:hypothetical protein